MIGSDILIYRLVYNLVEYKINAQRDTIRRMLCTQH